MRRMMAELVKRAQAKHYDKHDYWHEKRAALLAWEARLEEIQTGKPRSNVVQLRA